MKPASLIILGILLLRVFVFSAAAQSLAEKYKNEMFNPASNLQRQLERQQLAHERDKKVIAMVTLYPDPKNILMTFGFYVRSEGTYTEFTQGPMRGDSFGEWPLPANSLEKLKTLLLQLPAPKDPNPIQRQVIISFLKDGKWETQIYDGHQYRDVLEAILQIPSPDEFKLPPTT